MCLPNKQFLRIYIKINMIVNQEKLFSVSCYYVTNYGPRDGQIKKIEGDLSLSVDKFYMANSKMSPYFNPKLQCTPLQIVYRKSYLCTVCTPKLQN